jgi:hypothetical protein
VYSLIAAKVSFAPLAVVDSARVEFVERAPHPDLLPVKNGEKGKS